MVLAWALGACTESTGPVKSAQPTSLRERQAHLTEAPLVVHTDAQGAPTFITGALGTLPESPELQTAEAPLGAALEGVASHFQLDPGNLVLQRLSVDAQGDTHYHYSVLFKGLPILGAQLRVHVRDRQIFAANTNAHGGLRGPDTPRVTPEEAVSAALADRESPPDAQAPHPPRLVYYRVEDALRLVHEVRVSGTLEDGTPLDDSVLVDALDGSVRVRLPHVHPVLQRFVHDGKNLISLPGVLVRAEGAAPVADSSVNLHYGHLGTTHGCYSQLFGRSSYDNAGAPLVSTVHHLVKYSNAFWNGTQLAFGDGDGALSGNLAHALDITAHEYTHAVTDTESDLDYMGESGSLNESLSDIFGAVCEWYGDNKVLSQDTWRIGEDFWTPGVPGDALRYMNSPALDNKSVDYFPDYTSGMDVHYGSGIANLAFYLLSQGGTHPRGKTATVVPALGIEKAARIFYKANTDLLLPSATFESAKTATEQAAQQLGYDAATVAAVTKAWQAVGVGVPPPPPPSPPLTKDVPQRGLSGFRGQRQYFSIQVPEGAYDLKFTLTAFGGGGGDADLYVKFGELPTTTSYDCRPYKLGSEESCVFATPRKGTYYVMLNGFSNYSGLTLTVTWKGGYITIENGVAVTDLSGPPGSQQLFQFVLPARKNGETHNLHVHLSGGAGNVDLYVQRTSAPTLFSYDCRSVKEGTQEQCLLNNAEPGSYFILLYGAKGGYSGVTLKAAHP
jgi:vibriolysin